MYRAAGDRRRPHVAKGMNVNSRLQTGAKSSLVQERVVPGEEEAPAGGVDRDEAGKPDVYAEARATAKQNDDKKAQINTPAVERMVDG